MFDKWFFSTAWRVLCSKDPGHAPLLFFKFSTSNFGTSYDLYITDLVSLYHDKSPLNAIAVWLEVRLAAAHA